jgi:hypothetical protein
MGLNIGSGAYIASEGKIKDGIIPLAKMKTEIANANKLFSWNSSGVPTLAGLGMSQIAKTTVSGGAIQTVTISALTGDTDEMYMLQCYIVHGASDSNFSLQFNADGGANYNYCTQRWVNGSRGDSNNTGQTSLGNLNMQASINGVVTILIYAKSGGARAVVMSGGSGYSVNQISGRWTNTANEMTSITIVGSNATSIQNNSVFVLWKVA